MNQRTSQTANLLSGYRPGPGVYDEVCLPDGKSREKYEFLLRTFNHLGSPELRRRKEDSLRILQESGVTYNVYGDDRERVWGLDLFPLLMESKEWEGIERGLAQRSELLNEVLKDAYGPRRLLFERKIPHEVLFQSGGFLRACAPVYDSTNFRLAFVATDVSRDHLGNHYVIGDRIQAPSGSGYALENRIVLSRIFPSLYRDSQVHRVALYFRALRKTLNSFSPTKDREPLIILLTPGPGNETYFEHAYLAGYLGYTLAQSEDLTVRENKVFLKTVEGLQQVDVIFRRVDDWYMDPLELKGDSLLGVPGILGAVRAGNVVVANPIGSGFLENRAIHAYLSILCKFYLGEELILPNVPTLWMGEESSRNEVFSNPHKYVLKPAIRSPLDPSIFLSSLSDAEKEEWKQRVGARPERYVAQEILTGSTCPIFSGNSEELLVGKSVLRTFTTLSENGYISMPGGLVRVSPKPDELIITNQRGAISKDLWILASEEKKEFSLLPGHVGRIPLRRKGSGIPSRVADNMFWMGRYAERAENMSRLLRETVHKILEAEETYEKEQFSLLLGVVDQLSGFSTQFFDQNGADSLDTVREKVFALATSPHSSGSIRHDLNFFVGSSKAVRDRISDDTRYLISKLESEYPNNSSYDEVLEYLQKLVNLFASLSGLANESMSREAGFFFLDMGKRLERAQFISRLVLSAMERTTIYNKGIFESLLNVTDIRITYRRRYKYRIEAESVLDILLFDESNPRSLAFQLERLRENTMFISSGKGEEISEEIQILTDLLARFNEEDAKRIFEYADPAGGLKRWLLDILDILKSLSDAVAKKYFRYVENQVRLGGPYG
ncbi:carboxylate--amine ligase [Leptospira langatensis]|uniref:Carboxylate--amine ligase n=1 Tax=Leptospira langatensis TaxID=2484983 RepID=A0A5F1ZW65_9LEPT|nr:circularly permuted type 2 ATP-grasp protein [Leptospira langatensis]TGJ98191.1 carboxylate--amine ligase [Leptospira langatensis]TGL43105.1 carboxylate--amine ligase [Leptospira langatensis]